MKVLMLLLVSVVAQLVNPAVANPATHRPATASWNLNEIIPEAEKYNESLTREFFVEDVEPLFDAGCKDEFFCKVHDILHKHAHFGKRKNQEEDKILRHLGAFVRNRKNPNCTVLIRTVPTKVMKPVPNLLENLVKCIQKRNLNGDN